MNGIERGAQPLNMRTARKSSPACRIGTRALATLALGLGLGVVGGGGCVSNPPGVRGVAGTAPAPNVFWTPPPLPRPPPAETTPATPALPPDLASRIQAPNPPAVVGIALRKKPANPHARA